MKKIAIYSCALLVSAISLWANELTLVGRADKESALYNPGETMVFSVSLMDESTPVAGKKLKWTRSGDDGKTENGDAVSSATEPLKITTALSQPGFVRIEVWVLDENEKPLLNSKKHPIRFDGGAGVEVEKLQSIPEPADFDAFWAKQKERLAQVPLKFTQTEVPSTKPEFVVYDVKVDCAGGKPVSGYLSKPKNAAPKSLNARMAFLGYGVTSAQQDFTADAVVFAINAHGIENGKEEAYYRSLTEGPLKNYAFNNTENANPETAYFNGMVLRVLRALEFLKSQPEWNGKDLLVGGGSQGGFQAIAGAALDQSVTRCAANGPWCCDLGGITLGRLRGWRPDYVEGLGYYDPVNMAKRIRCPIIIGGGLGDYVCPPSGICVLYNNIKTSKQLQLHQGRTHAYVPANPQKITLNAK